MLLCSRELRDVHSAAIDEVPVHLRHRMPHASAPQPSWAVRRAPALQKDTCCRQSGNVLHSHSRTHRVVRCRIVRETVIDADESEGEGSAGGCVIRRREQGEGRRSSGATEGAACALGEHRRVDRHERHAAVVLDLVPLKVDLGEPVRLVIDRFHLWWTRRGVHGGAALQGRAEKAREAGLGPAKGREPARRCPYRYPATPACSRFQCCSLFCCFAGRHGVKKTHIERHTAHEGTPQV